MLERYLDYGYFPTPPLYYLSIYLLSYLIPVYPYIISAIIVLTISSFLKYLFAFKYLKEGIETSSRRILLIGVLSFSLMFAAPVIIPFINNEFLYVGKFTSTIWHNSTTIFVIPFCIWLFIDSLHYIKKPGGWLFWKLLILSVIILVAKPSFLFAFVVVFPIICLYKFGWNRNWFLYSIFLSGTILICLVIEKNIIYQNNPLDKLWYEGKSSKIIIAPFKVWLIYAKHPLLNILTSFLFLISFLFLKFRKAVTDIDILYSFSLLIISLIIFFTFAESGPRFTDANFYWQIPCSLFLANLVVLKKVVVPYLFKSDCKLKIKNISFTDKFLLFFYSLHVLSGVYYTLRIIVERNYY